MKVKFGAIITDGRGKIGGQVLSKSRSGAYMKNKVTPVNRRSVSQGATRSKLAALAQAWRNLIDVQRLAWGAAVDQYKRTNIFGDIKNPSGFQLYVRLNRNLDSISVAHISVPPAFTSPIQPVIGTINFDISDAKEEISWTPVVGANNNIVVEATAPMSQGKMSSGAAFRVIDGMTPDTAQPYSIKTAYQAKFGSAMPLGAKVYVRLKAISSVSGLNSSYSTGSAIIVT